MQRSSVKILFLGLAIFAMAFGCGKQEEGSLNDALEISLGVPPGEPLELFWYGVDQKRLEIAREDKSVFIDWEGEKTLDLELDEGDRLIFQGLDREGRLLVTGEAVVGLEKRISVPLRRVL